MFLLQLAFLCQRSNCRQDIDNATRTAIALVSNIIRVLASRSVPITDTIILEAYEWAVEQDVNVKDLLLEDVADTLVAAVITKEELSEPW
jgi:exosome complex component RRP4